MNKAVTEGIVFMPTPFAEGLNVWSSGDGVPGSDTYDGSGGGVFVPADQDFGGCMELVKTSSTQKIRYMAQTPVLPGCYIRVRARVKVVAGALPTVRIAGYAAEADGTLVSSALHATPQVQLTTYGEVVTVEGIIGPGERGGVDLFWPQPIAYGHFGIDFLGPNGGVLRVDDIEIEDVTSIFLRDMMSMVDVRDFGAVGDGTTDDHGAFLAADQAAAGREILVPEGTFRINTNISITNRIRFEGTVTLPSTVRIILMKNFDLPTYVDAFGDEELAFKKAFQALLFFNDHDSLDLGGRRVALTEPLDMQAAVPSRDSFATRRVIRNGQFHAIEGPAWDTDVVTAQGSYSAGNARQLTNVANAALIPVGSLVEGNGVGREVFVTGVNTGAQTVTLSQELFDAEGTQSFTFRRFKYLLDFSNFDRLAQFFFEGVEFAGEGIASGVMLARDGINNGFTDCFFTKPKDRGITSIGNGCQGLTIDRCQFISNETEDPALVRTTVAFNANANDIKLRSCRGVRFKHFGLLAGTGNTIVGNHWFMGDEEPDGILQGGLIFTRPNAKSHITGNYIDNNFIEWTNEHTSEPDFSNQFSFGGLTVSGNTFTTKDVVPSSKLLVIKPHGAGHYISGLTVIGNVFRTVNGRLDRIEHIDTTFATLDFGRFFNIVFSGNTFHGVDEPVYNPVSVNFDQNTAHDAWVVDFDNKLPFQARTRTVQSVVKRGRIETASGDTVWEEPWTQVGYGTGQDQVRLNWPTDCTGTVTLVARIDNPT